MMLGKVFKPAGAIATTVCAVATGIAVNLSILSASPDGTGNLAVGTQRATTTSVAPSTTSTPLPNRPARVVVHVAAPAPATPLVGSNGHDSGSTSAPPSSAPSTTGVPPTHAPSTTSTTVPRPPDRHTSTYKVGNAGTVSAHWLSSTEIEVVARPAPGWSVSLHTVDNERVTATFVQADRGIVWKGRVDGHHLHVEMHHFTRRDAETTTTTPSPIVATPSTEPQP